MNPTDVQSWKNTAILLGIISVVMFALQRSSYTVFDVGFEICIFHMPAVLAVGVYLYLRRKSEAPAFEAAVPA